MATSLAICKIFEQVYKILLQDVSDFDASQPASFLQEPYVIDTICKRALTVRITGIHLGASLCGREKA